ncbi:UDP-glucose/GDP-mannose dehydrogenase family protein [Alicyclobacillus curvatus]|nr:UDP-glucose/GDP-mannose dehydrogenase family protein [Alicyclobacillus curvatus]
MVTVIGLGFVGLTTAVGLSFKGHRVFGYDIDDAKVAMIRTGTLPFYEPGLKEALTHELSRDLQIVGKNQLDRAIDESDVIFYCVGTPSSDLGAANLSYLCQAIQDTSGKFGDAFKTLVVKSTVPPQTTKKVIVPLLEDMGFRVGLDVGLAVNPEFLREGHAWEDFVQPDRVVIGCAEDKSRKVLAALYQPFAAPVQFVSYTAAEFIKYMSNTLLATMISFANEMSMLADKFEDIDVKQSFDLLRMDKRWSGTPAPMTAYVYPGCGFGGYCLPKDTRALIRKADEAGQHPTLLDSVLKVNDDVKDFVVSKISAKVPLEEPIGILGLAFKPGSDDTRGTPAADIIRLLQQRGYQHIVAYDPMAMEEFKRNYPFQITYADSLDELSEKAKYLVVLTAWPEFKQQQQLFDKAHVYDFRYFL